jgi:hypothetical protein
MKIRLVAAFVLSFGLVASASAQSIGVFWDPAGATCAVNQPSGSQGTMYILASLGGPSLGGMTGAEFRVDNFPSTWFANATPSPASNLALGGPLTGGCNIAFPACQVGSGGLVLLYTVSYFAVDAQANRRISVLRHTTPSNANFQCPLQTLCDEGIFTKVCVSGGQGIINGGNCTVAVQQKSWSGVKSLFN